MKLEFWVPGTPRPQGSKTGKVVKGRVVMYDSATGLKEWRNWVTRIARERAEEAGWPLAVGEVGITMAFSFTPPKNPSRTYPPRNDVDKLARAVNDAITAAGIIWHDDDQITSMVVTKAYGSEAGVLVAVHAE